MAADGVYIKLEGVDDLKRAMSDVSGKIRKKAITSALREAGKVIQGEARANAPVLSKPAPYRKPGTVKKSIVVRASKFARKAGDAGVYVSVRPLSGKRQVKLGKAGAKNPNDPFYWRFLEFGTKFFKPGAGLRFMTNAAKSKGPEAIRTFMASAQKQIERLANRVR